MARGGARPGAGRPARKSANTSTVSARARPRARGGRKSTAVAGRQGRALGDRPADPVCQKCTDPHGCPGRRDRGKHQGVGLDDASAGGRGRRTDCPPPGSSASPERWPVDRLIPYAKNARTHSDAQIGVIAASIKEWGWTTPALVGEDGGLIAGHARILAARQLGIPEPHTPLIPGAMYGADGVM